MTQYFYGAESHDHIKKAAAKSVIAFGGGEIARRAMLEIACAETLCGTFPDANPLKHGIGITQIDKIGFDDVQLHVRNHDKKAFKLHYGRDIETVKHEELAFNIELAFAFTRLIYKRIPQPIPKTLAGRAHYWKRYYNTFHPNAKGTADDYLDKVRMTFGR